MIPPVKLGLLALGPAGWPLELEVDSRGSYGGRPSYAFCSSPPLSLSPESNILPGLVFRGAGQYDLAQIGQIIVGGDGDDWGSIAVGSISPSEGIAPRVE
jgi:hypothetical protein